LTNLFAAALLAQALRKAKCAVQMMRPCLAPQPYVPSASPPVAGLTRSEAALRLSQDRPNVLPGTMPKTLVAIVLGVITEPINEAPGHTEACRTCVGPQARRTRARS
jgi:Ca2+-transporting ATPase